MAPGNRSARPAHLRTVDMKVALETRNDLYTVGQIENYLLTALPEISGVTTPNRTKPLYEIAIDAVCFRFSIASIMRQSCELGSS
jgi:hypothetical protein